jgi:hypothetical protein
MRKAVIGLILASFVLVSSWLSGQDRAPVRYTPGGTDVPIGDGGTGQSTKAAGFDALAPGDTKGDVIYHDGSNHVKLGIGNTDDVLTVAGGIPSWASASVDPVIDTANEGYMFLPLVHFGDLGGVLGEVGAKDQTRFAQFVLPHTIIVQDLTYEVVTKAAGQNCGISIYDSTGTETAVTTGAFSAASTGIVTVALGSAQTLSPGVYFVGWTCDSTTPKLRAWRTDAGNTIVADFLNNNTASPNERVGTAANSGSAGDPPATLGTRTADNTIEQWPVILVER